MDQNNAERDGRNQKVRQFYSFNDSTTLTSFQMEINSKGWHIPITRGSHFLPVQPAEMIWYHVTFGKQATS